MSGNGAYVAAFLSAVRLGDVEQLPVMSWAEAHRLRDSLRASKSRVACGLILPTLGGTVARVERRGLDMEKILAGGGVTSDATSRRWIAACMIESLFNE